MWKILLAIFAFVLVLVLLCICKAAGEADAQMKQLMDERGDENAENE